MTEIETQTELKQTNQLIANESIEDLTSDESNDDLKLDGDDLKLNDENSKADEEKSKDASLDKFEFDCPKSFDLKDPMAEFDLEENKTEYFDTHAESIRKTVKKTTLPRNQTHTRLQNADKKASRSPILKKRKFKPVTYNHRKPITNVNERIYNAAKRRQPVYKSLLELVQEFDKKARVYDENLNDKTAGKNLRKTNYLPKSPKLLSKNRNRTRTALSKLEQDDLIARTNKKNTFKAQPINKKIFDNYATGIPKVNTKPQKSVCKNLEFGFQTSKRLDAKRENASN